MIIQKIKKGKQNTYEITFQNEIKHVFYDDIVVKYRLLPKKEIKDQELENMIQENDRLNAYYVALRFLTLKQRTKKELTNYLKKKNFSKEAIITSIDLLEREGYLKESDYIRSFLHDSFYFTKDGPLKIKNKLLEQALPEDLIDTIFAEIPKDLWLEKLEKTYQKKADSHHTDGLEKWQYKCVQYLRQLGYHLDWINEVGSKIKWPQDENLIKKEQEKLKRKLIRKYSGKELELQMNHRLYLKGFSKEEIDSLKKER